MGIHCFDLCIGFHREIWWVHAGGEVRWLHVAGGRRYRILDELQRVSLTKGHVIVLIAVT
jgi:hypothetical protein